MAEFSDYMENKIIEVMRATDFTAVAAQVALFMATSTEEGDLAALDAELEAGTLTKEVPTAGGTLYERQAAGLGAASGGASSNEGAITFPTAGADWGTVTHVALMDSDVEGAGNVFMWSRLDAFKTIANGDTFKINATELDVTVA
ncbi:hypothetical protein ES703_56430 [subsurface metagenome]